MKKTILVMTAGLVVLVLIYFLVAFQGRFPQVQRSSSMPGVADESMDDLLLSLEDEWYFQ